VGKKIRTYIDKGFVQKHINIALSLYQFETTSPGDCHNKLNNFSTSNNQANLKKTFEYKFFKTFAETKDFQIKALLDSWSNKGKLMFHTKCDFANVKGSAKNLSLDTTSCKLADADLQQTNQLST
jgi:hypothetical protein